MRVFKEQLTLNSFIKKQSRDSIGLVPTMGALHFGHLTLVDKAVSENDCVIVSIFVNPTQFDDASDLNSYPKTLEEDLQKLAPYGNQILVYAPEVKDVYPDEACSNRYTFGLLETTMEGAEREGHFQGVATIVHKLLSGFKPTRAYFGEKDYQQLCIIQQLVLQEKLPVNIVKCPIIREKDGLAMSSRNTRLSEKDRAQAALIYATLNKTIALKNNSSIEDINHIVQSTFDQNPDFRLDYFCIADAQSLQPITTINHRQAARAFIAVKLGGVRLIDNVNF
ncbi:MAG: pantoate--beta-alanine ligase [Flavobacteriaceae bacterium]|nr:pantoate--beta-alanine ligase [Flavobacteriaceae bacterium]